MTDGTTRRCPVGGGSRDAVGPGPAAARRPAAHLQCAVSGGV